MLSSVLFQNNIVKTLLGNTIRDGTVQKKLWETETKGILSIAIH